MGTAATPMNTLTLPLDISNDAGDLRLLSVTIVTEPDLPFAVVRYSENGTEARLGLRIDLDKMAFLDRIGDAGHDSFAQSIAPRIVDEVYEQVYKSQSGFGRRASGAYAD